MTQPDNGTRSSAVAAIQATLAATCACTERDLAAEGGVVTEAQELIGRLRFPLWSKALRAVTMGSGVVLSCHPARVAWARAVLAGKHRDAIFSAETMAEIARYVGRDGQDLIGPVLQYACSRADLRPVSTPSDIEISLLEGTEIAPLYAIRGFEEALGYRLDSPRPTMLAAVATRAGNVVGIAAASADSDTLWHIGVAVAVTERGRGVGRAVVGRLSDGVLVRGRIPYYSTTVANIASQSIAVSLGYWPAWTELYARDR